MTDARFRDRWLNDRRMQGLEPDAFRAYVNVLAWCASNRTDGYVAAYDLASIPHAAEPHSDALVAAGLWKKDGDGWTVVDFADTQTSAAELEVAAATKVADRARKAKSRAAQKAEAAGRDAGLAAEYDAFVASIPAKGRHKPEVATSLRQTAESCDGHTPEPVTSIRQGQARTGAYEEGLPRARSPAYAPEDVAVSGWPLPGMGGRCSEVLGADHDCDQPVTGEAAGRDFCAQHLEERRETTAGQ